MWIFEENLNDTGEGLVFYEQRYIYLKAYITCFDEFECVIPAGVVKGIWSKRIA